MHLLPSLRKTNTTEFLTPTHTHMSKAGGDSKANMRESDGGCTSNFIVAVTKHYDQGNLQKEGLMVHNGGAEVAGCRWHEQQLRAEG